MSANLAFRKNKNRVEFPFQTPTYLSYAIAAQHNSEDKVKVLTDYFKANYPQDFKQPQSDWRKRYLKCCTMLRDASLTLIVE